MPTTARDLRYGRRGGGWIAGDGRPPRPPAICDVCGRPAFTGSRHQGCTVDDPQLSMLDEPGVDQLQLVQPARTRLRRILDDG